MSIELKHCTFIHVPKAAGTWVATQLHKLDLVVKGGAGSHDSPELKKPGFAFVRDPEEWVISHWCHRRRNNWCWNQYRRLDVECQSEDFRTWIENIIQHPGIVQRTLEDFIRRYEGLNFHLGKVENAKEDLIRLLAMFGEEFDPEIIRTSDPVHVSLERPTIPDDLIRAFRDSQRGYYEKYNYLEKCNEHHTI